MLPAKGHCAANALDDFRQRNVHDVAQILQPVEKFFDRHYHVKLPQPSLCEGHCSFGIFRDRLVFGGQHPHSRIANISNVLFWIIDVFFHGLGNWAGGGRGKGGAVGRVSMGCKRRFGWLAGQGAVMDNYADCPYITIPTSVVLFELA